MKNFKVLPSSAGAGKTHALVKQYLELALHSGSPAGYAEVLALTFTNAAAAEMRERVLGYLKALASGDPLKGAEADLQQHLTTELKVDAHALARRAAAMYKHMLHHWSGVAISTIDAFVRRVVMPFTRDLGLDSELQMTTEEEYYRNKAVDLLLEEAGGSADLTEALLATGEQLLDEERTWRVDVPLIDLSQELSKEAAIHGLASLADMTTTEFIAIRDRLRRQTDDFRDKMRELGRAVLKAIEDAGLTEQDLAGGSRGLIVYFRRLRDFDLDTYLGTGGAKALGSDVWNSGKASQETIRTIEGLVPLFRETISTVESWRDNEMAEYLVRRAILKNIMPMASLEALNDRLATLKEEERVHFFSDLTRRVRAIVAEEPVPFLYERLGERYTDFLIDEFQDTSVMQWQAMLPLVENALSAGGSVFVVGDAKQAIYRWRNGEARQFAEFPKVFGKEHLAYGDAYEMTLEREFDRTVEPLADNYRSARSIIEFNNGIIGHLQTLLDAEGQRIYDAHEQAVKRNLEGYVKVEKYNSKEDKEAPWERMMQAVNACVEDGYDPGDIAVLVRGRKQASMASKWLLDGGWGVASSDGMRLMNEPVVRAVVHVLWWLYRPIDENAAKAVQAIEAVKAPVVDPFGELLAPKAYMEHWKAGHPTVRLGESLMSLVHGIARALGRDPATDVYLMTLLDEAHRFGMNHGNDLPGFLEHWDRTGKNTTVPAIAEKSKVRVMTIHKAKGLAFPIVILPDAGVVRSGSKKDLVWIAPEAAVGDLPAGLVQYSDVLADAGVPELEEEQRLKKLDALNLLYVAMTRPEDRLYMSVPEGGGGFLVAGLLDHLEWDQAGICERGIPERKQGKGEPEPDTALKLVSTEGDGARDLAIRIEATDEWDPLDPDPFRRYGNAVHDLLEQVRTMADLDRLLEREDVLPGIPPEQRHAIGMELKALLAKPDVAPFFRPGLTAHAEATLLDAEGNLYRPDRVVRDGHRLQVLDFKTGRPDETHHRQVRNYMRLLAEVEPGTVEGYLLYTRDGALVRVEP